MKNRHKHLQRKKAIELAEKCYLKYQSVEAALTVSYKERHLTYKSLKAIEAKVAEWDF